MSGPRGTRRLGVAGALIEGATVAGDLEVTDGIVSAHGLRPLGSGLAVPGFVDLQVNGFAGVDFLHAEASGYERAGIALAATGVTAYRPTLVSATPDRTAQSLAVLASLHPRRPGPRVLAAHLEGPFLSPARPGAHDPAHLRPPSVPEADALCAAGPVGMVTVAPELDGCMALIAHLSARGVAVSLGHSDADAEQADAAFDAGAVAVTHVFNAMRPIRARDPGLAGAALARPAVVVMAIVDDVHLAAAVVQLLLVAAAGRLCLVTDAIEAATLGDGSHRLGPQAITVRGAEVRLAGGTLAGSVLTMDAAVRNLVGHGATVAEAVDAATRVPGLLAGDRMAGRLVRGGRADIAVLDDSLQVRRTLVGGIEVFAG